MIRRSPRTFAGRSYVLEITGGDRCYLERDGRTLAQGNARRVEYAIALDLAHHATERSAAISWVRSAARRAARSAE